MRAAPATAMVEGERVGLDIFAVVAWRCGAAALLSAFDGDDPLALSWSALFIRPVSPASSQPRVHGC
ncbi:MAG: hypothetical protein EX270_03985 [Pseudomonadales bacterium]|nr:MAG: hypothetical protein EX270_03985 [Pseudomonadales bacterium]